MNLTNLGLIFNIIGTIILALVTLIDWRHQRQFIEKGSKKYWWNGRKPVWRDTKTFKWKFKWKSWVVREGFIPPNHQWTIIGLLFLLIGFILQILPV